MSNLRVGEVEVLGEFRALLLAAELIGRSQWFEFEPIPDGHFKFTVKQEFIPELWKIVAAIRTAHRIQPSELSSLPIW